MIKTTRQPVNNMKGFRTACSKVQCDNLSACISSFPKLHKRQQRFPTCGNVQAQAFTAMRVEGHNSCPV